jgi:hypothetical protein
MRRLLVSSALLAIACGNSCHGPGGSDLGPEPHDLAGDASGPSDADLGAALAKARAAIAAGQTRIDLNGDGRVDLVRTFSGTTLTEETIDWDGDGQPDLIWTYGASNRLQMLTAGHLDEEIVTTPDPSNPGVFSYSDTVYASDPAQPDVRWSFTVDPSQDTVDVVREEAPNHDGNFQQVDSFSQPRIQPASNDVGVTVDDVSCGSGAAAVAAAAGDAITMGFTCLKNVAPDLAWALIHDVAVRGVSISCDTSDDCGSTDLVSLIPIGSIKMTVNPNASGCGSLKATIFHELLHDILGTHNLFYGSQDLYADRIQSCEYFCFVGPNSISCAGCLGAKNGDKRCNGYPQRQCPCGDPGGVYCACNFKVYCDVQQCTNECIASLACFSGICGPEQGPCGK